MGKLVVSLDNVVIKEVPITKDRTTLGRRPYNDIVIDNLAVSGEHAVMLAVGNDVFIEDLNSTNGTYINGKAIEATLVHNDTVGSASTASSTLSKNFRITRRPWCCARASTRPARPRSPRRRTP
jgi:pSer/pThr/pTyr-binding forkhead associated (FHA) protein